jgi:hypothetical protein
MDYNKLATSEKTLVTKMLNAKIALDKAQKAYNKAIENGLEVARKSGTIKKGYAKIIYTPAGDYMTLDTVKIKAEHPELAEEYSKEVSRKESVKVLL